MPDSNVTSISGPSGTPLHDQLIEATAALDLVLHAIEHQSLHPSEPSKLSSAESVLRTTIETLHELAGDVEELQWALDQKSALQS